MARKQPTQEEQDRAYKQAQKRIAQCLEKGDTELDLTAVKLTAIPPEIGQCVHITRFFCRSNLISDLSPLANLSNLEVLNCMDNQISDLSPLANLSNLIRLHCVDNQISDLSPLAGLSNLETLNCMDNQISDLSPLTNLSNLETLNCMDNQISDLSPLANLSNLTWLDFDNNPIAESSDIWQYLADLDWSECAKPTLAYLNGDFSFLPDELRQQAQDNDVAQNDLDTPEQNISLTDIKNLPSSLIQSVRGYDQKTNKVVTTTFFPRWRRTDFAFDDSPFENNSQFTRVEANEALDALGQLLSEQYINEQKTVIYSYNPVENISLNDLLTLSPFAAASIYAWRRSDLKGTAILLIVSIFGIILINPEHPMVNTFNDVLREFTHLDGQKDNDENSPMSVIDRALTKDYKDSSG